MSDIPLWKIQIGGESFLIPADIAQSAGWPAGGLPSQEHFDYVLEAMGEGRQGTSAFLRAITLRRQREAERAALELRRAIAKLEYETQIARRQEKP